MNRRSAFDIVMIVIGAITLFSAVAQVAAPTLALGRLGLRADTAARLMLTLASCFSAVFGAALLHTVLSHARDRAVLLWVALAKFCGPALFAVAILQRLIPANAAWVALYDALAGAAVLWYRALTPRSLVTHSRLEANQHGEAQAAKLET